MSGWPNWLDTRWSSYAGRMTDADLQATVAWLSRVFDRLYDARAERSPEHGAMSVKVLGRLARRVELLHDEVHRREAQARAKARRPRARAQPPPDVSPAQ